MADDVRPIPTAADTDWPGSLPTVARFVLAEGAEVVGVVALIGTGCSGWAVPPVL
jgi:hypothetical protein